MLHPRLTPLGATPGGSSSVWLAQIGDYGAWSDLTVTARWGEGSAGMFEATWNMPLPPGFEHPLLRRGVLVEMMHGALRVGSPFVMAEPGRGSGFDQPWRIVATGIGREVEGQDGFYALDGSGNTTAVPSTAVDAAITRGWRIDGRAASVPTTAIGGSSTTDELMSLGSLLNAADDQLGQRHYVGQDNYLAFAADPTTPTYQIAPGVAELGTGDDGYATEVLVRYQDSVDSAYKSVTAQDDSALATEGLYGHREFAQNMIDKGAVSTATAQSWADGILALAKGRLAWTGGLTVTNNELLTMGGEAASLSKVLEDVGNGCMVRLHGIWSDLLAYNGQTYIDVVLGEAKYVDGAQTIELNPLGLTARDLASFAEQVSAGVASAA